MIFFSSLWWKWRPFPCWLAPFRYIILGVYSGSRTSLVRVLWICRSLMCGASMGRILPRSRSMKWAPGFGRHFPESTSRRRRAVPENRCRSKFCVDCFHLTLLQHFFPHLNIFRKLNACSMPPRASHLRRLLASRAAFRLWYRASRRSSLVIISIRASVRLWCRCASKPHDPGT